MTDLFISYARTDHQQAGCLAAAIEAAGYSVWWDRQLLSGDEFSTQIEQALIAAKQVIVCWSSDAANSRWVRDEAAIAADSGKLMAVSLDGSEPPIGFRQYHYDDLSKWQGNVDSAALQPVIRAVNARLNPNTVAPSLGQSKAQRRVGPVASLAIAGLVAIGGMMFWASKESESASVPSSPAAPEPSVAAMDTTGEHLRTIAVLPFDNYSPNPQDAYFAAGITEEITGQLARIDDLTVLSRVAVERAVDAGGSLEDIATDLGAGTVLEGSVRMAGKRVRITAQLIEATSQKPLWSDNFDRELADIFQVQTDVALAIGKALLAQLSSGERQRIETPATENIQAYQLFLKQGRLMGSSPQQNQQAINLLEQALVLDPNYAEAQARLSWRFTWVSRLTGDPAAAQRAEQLAREALRSDPNLAHAHYSLGSALGELERVEDQGAAFARAYELDPNFPSILSDSSEYFAITGRPALGLEMAFRYVRIDPNDPNARWHASQPLRFLGDRERTAAWLKLARDEGMVFHRLAVAEAELALMFDSPDQSAEIARRMLEQFPDILEAQLVAMQVLFLTSNWSEVSEALLDYCQEAPNAWLMAHLAPRSARVLAGYLQAEQGRDGAAGKIFDDVLDRTNKAVADGSTHQGRALDAASVYAYRGQHEPALDQLDRAYELGFRADFVLAIDPFFASLRDEPRFKALLNRMAASQREQREIAHRNGALEGYDKLIAAGPAGG